MHRMDRPLPPAPRLPLLDGMRGIAAIGVMLYHAHFIFGLREICGHGYLFVDFFFVLSGFVLTLGVEPRMRPRPFMIARVRRFWPMVALGVALGVVQQLTEGVAWPAVLGCAVAALVMMPMVHAPSAIFPLNGPQWSLMMELLANLAHATVLRRLGRRGLIAVIVLSGVVLAPLVLAQGWGNLGPFAWNWPMAVPRVLFSYALGVLMARHWRAERVLPHRVWWLPLALLPAVGVLTRGAWGDLAAMLALMPAIFLMATMARPPLPAQRVLTALGRLSFPLYATQVPTMILIRLALGAHPWTWLAGMAGALATAHLAALGLERRSPRRPAARRPTPLATA